MKRVDSFLYFPKATFLSVGCRGRTKSGTSKARGRVKLPENEDKECFSTCFACAARGRFIKNEHITKRNTVRIYVHGSCRKRVAK